MALTNILPTVVLAFWVSTCRSIQLADSSLRETPTTWSEFAKVAKTGDLVMSTYDSSTSKAIRTVTRSDYSHTGFVAVMRCTESSGCEMVPKQGNGTDLYFVAVEGQPIPVPLTGPAMGSMFMPKFGNSEDVMTKDPWSGMKVTPWKRIIGARRMTSIGIRSLKSPICKEGAETCPKLELLKTLTSCLHAVRTRYTLNPKMWAKGIVRQGKQELNAFDTRHMVCSDFAQLLMGEWQGEGVSGGSCPDVAQMRTPKMSRTMGLDLWDSTVLQIKYESMKEWLDEEVKGYVDDRELVGSRDPEVFRPKGMHGYEDELQQCKPELFKTWSRCHPRSYNAFREDVVTNTQSVRVWEGHGTENQGRTSAEMYARFVAAVTPSGQRVPMMYYVKGKRVRPFMVMGEQLRENPMEDPDAKLEQHVLDLAGLRMDHRGALTVPTKGGETVHFTVEWLKEGDYLLKALQSLGKWASTKPTTTSLKDQGFPVMVYPTTEVQHLDLQGSGLVAKDMGGGVTHVRSS